MPLQIAISEAIGSVSALWTEAPEARHGLLLAHGAGAGMHHVFMNDLAMLLAERNITTLRYQFPYMERGSRRPDYPNVLKATIKAAWAKAVSSRPQLTWFAGGKSMGGRISSACAAEGQLPGLNGLVFFGFPLHPAGKPGTDRAAHLDQITTPMLFLQGTRDRLADLTLITEVTSTLTTATMHVVDGADHGFKVLKRSGRNDQDVLLELADTAAGWMAQ